MLAVMDDQSAFPLRFERARLCHSLIVLILFMTKMKTVLLGKAESHFEFLKVALFWFEDPPETAH